jgi:hypothetical protein
MKGRLAGRPFLVRDDGASLSRMTPPAARSSTGAGRIIGSADDAAAAFAETPFQEKSLQKDGKGVR